MLNAKQLVGLSVCLVLTGCLADASDESIQFEARVVDCDTFPLVDGLCLEPKVIEGDILVHEGFRPLAELSWEGTLPYQFADPSSYSTEELQHFAQKVEGLNRTFAANGVNMEIVPRTVEEDYVNVTNIDRCSSFVGKQGGPQTLNLGSGCFSGGAVVHEFFHALGLPHEHNRSDRDTYVIVHLDEVIEDKEHNFDINDLPLEGQFDFDSVMMYASTFFQKGEAFTMTRRPEFGTAEITYVSVESAGDLNDLMLRYPLPEPEEPPADTCEDTDGDGWGWGPNGSCKVEGPQEAGDCVDDDGDGWGWNGVESCRTTTAPERTECLDPDGDGWGWDGVDSCRV